MSILARSPADRIIVVGAGVAGLATALRLAPRPVTLITQAPLGGGTATGWAQATERLNIASDIRFKDDGEPEPLQGSHATSDGISMRFSMPATASSRSSSMT